MKPAESEVMMGDEQPRDRKGRRRYTQERRTELVREHAGSGLTQAEFTRREGLNFTTFAHWAAEVSAALSATLPDGAVLRGSEPSHPYLAERRFNKATVERFGLGYCARGSLAGRIAIPLQDAEGRLVGYAGRGVDDAAVSEENPKYRFLGPRSRDGTLHEFKKGLFLYNGHHLKPTSHDLVVVEGFPSVWWLFQNGFGRVVSTMGAECSEEQARLILSLVSQNGRIVLMPDGDKADERCAQSILPMLSPHRFVRWAQWEEGRQPTDLWAQELKVYLAL